MLGYLTSLAEAPEDADVDAMLEMRPTFVRQLELIDLSEEDRFRAVSDYLRTSPKNSLRREWVDFWAGNGRVGSILEGPVIEIPRRISAKTHNVDAIKGKMNSLAGLTGLAFDPSPETAGKERPSFRDLMAFIFQPQNIVANPDVLFFKADTTEHREKLRIIFPYVLGAVTSQILLARFELDRLGRILRRREAELRAVVSSTATWQREAHAWLRQAIEYGLLPAGQRIPEEWPQIVDLLRSIVRAKPIDAQPSIEGVDASLVRLNELRRAETVSAGKLSENRQRLKEIHRLIESSEAFGGAMRIHRDRLSLSGWMRGLYLDADEPLASLVGVGRDQLIALCDALEGLEIRLRSHPSMSDTHRSSQVALAIRSK